MRERLKRNLKNRWQRIVAVLLVAVMLAPVCFQMVAYAQPVYEEVMIYELEDMTAQLLESEEAVAITQSTVTFPVTAAVLNVGQELIFHVFRQGSTDKEETITIGTYDMTAGYGEDYEILVDGETIDGEAKKMLDGEGTVYDVYLGEDVLADSEEDSDVEGSSDDVDETAQYLEEMASSTFDITFAKGETVKEIRIRGFMPDKATGNKELQMMIMECDDTMEIGENGTVGITLQETRETEEAEINIVADSAEVVDGYVTVMVERTGNTDSYAYYNLSSENGTAENGSDFVLNAAQLTFTPGVTQQRIHIPLVSSETEETKTFTLRANDSEEEVTYTTTTLGATFAQSRDKIDIPMSEFTRGGYTADTVDFYSDSDDERYIFSFDTGVGDGDHRTASIRTKSTYDFTGIEYIRISASYRVGTIIGDFLDVYASDTDYYNNLPQLAAIPTNQYGSRLSTVSLTGQGIHDIYVHRIGEYNVYMTAEQHNGCGYIGYNLYDQEFNGGDEGHVALIKKAYDLQIVSPREISKDGVSTSPAGSLSFTLLSDSSVIGQELSGVYRDDSFQFSYTAIDDVYFKGYEILDDASGNVIFTRWTDSTVFCLDSEVLRYVESAGAQKVYVRPVFEREEATVTIEKQDFAGMGFTTLSVTMDTENKKAVYYDNGVEMATITWNTNSFKKGDTLKFTVKENSDYEGDYHFDSFMVRSSYNSSFSDSNPIYYSDKNWNTTITRDYYEITPMFSCANAPLYLVVNNPTCGSFVGKPSNLTSTDAYTVKDYDGKYDASDIVTFVATPNDGYRAKWSYHDVATGTTKTYYGNVFYYQVQFPVVSTDNYVTLEFVNDASSAKAYTLTATVYMQGGDVLHQPDADCADYTPLEGAKVSIEGDAKETNENGSTGSTVYTINGKSGETYTSLVFANNRSYVHDITLPDSNASSISEKIYLSYYYEGPRVTSVKYYDKLGTTQNGDTIFLEDQLDSVVIAATVEANNKEVTEVRYTLQSADGTVKLQTTAEVSGKEYLWSIDLGTYAEEGDEIWIELINEETTTASDGTTTTKTTSYGKVNTGYVIEIAEYNAVSYIPDTGNKSVTVPFWGNMFFNFSIKGIKPVITTSRSGNIFFLTLGVNGNFAKNFSNGKWTIPSWTQFNNNRKAGMEVFSSMGYRDEQKVAVQTMKKNTLSFNFPVSFMMAFYFAQDEETYTMESYFVGAYFSIGVNATYLYSYPFLFYVLPMFVNLQVTVGISDTVQIYETTDTGLVAVSQMSDPSKSAYRPDNDFNFKASVGLSLGAGVNSVLSFSGGGSGTFSIDWIDYSYGKGVMSLSIDARVEVILVGRTFSKKIANYEMFNTNPYVAATADEAGDSSDAAAEMQDILNTVKLGDLSMKSIDSYKQSLIESALRSSAGSSGTTLIDDAYEFSSPEILSMGNDRYLIVATVASQFVNGYEDAEDTAVMSYAIYDANAGAFEKETDAKVFTSLEPMDEEGAPVNPGDSLNFNPNIVEIEENEYAVVWNSLVYGNSETEDSADGETSAEPEALTVDKMRIVIKSAVIKTADSATETVDPIYNSIVTTNESDGIMPSLVVETVYDEANDQVILLYRTLDFTNLTTESTLGDYANVGTALSVTSLDVSDTALAAEDNAWSEAVTLATGGSGSVLKNADMAMMKDGDSVVPIVTYHMTNGDNAGLLSEAEEDTTNHIYLASLKKSGSGYAINKEAEVPLDTSAYQTNPQLATGTAGGTESGASARAILMWRQDERMAVADPIDILNDNTTTARPKNEDDDIQNTTNAEQATGLATINETFAGNNDDFQLVEGDDGRLYCLWTEGYFDASTGEHGSQVMMSYLDLKSYEASYENESGKTVTINEKVASWTKGKELYRTAAGHYVQTMSVVVNEDGDLQTLYRQTDLSNDAGSSKIQLQGLTGLKEKLTKVEEEDSFIQGAVYAAPDVQISAIDFEPLNVTDGTNPDTYKVKATITNAGEADSEETEMVVSYLESKNTTDADGVTTDAISETTLGQVTVPALAVGESADVEFEITVDQSYYTKAYFKIAPIGVALYEYYGTDAQNMVDMILDGVQALQEEEATDVEVDETVTVARSSSHVLQATVYPLIAQNYTKLTYKSLNPEIATVDENGVITALKNGICKIEVSTENGITKTVEVTVTDKVIDDSTEPGGSGDSGNNGAQDGGSGSGTNGTGNNNGSGADTGDHANPVLWAVVCAVAAAGIVIAIIYKKKKK